MPFDREATRQRVATLAARGVLIGTSSWKYEGWLGQLYTPARYEYRGKVAKTRFQRDCLSEYAEVFKTVCVDAAYYDFPRSDYLQRLADQVPEDFRFGFKVTDAITIKKFPTLDRFGAKAGQSNPDFLNADLFTTAFLKPCETIRDKTCDSLRHLVGRSGDPSVAQGHMGSGERAGHRGRGPVGGVSSPAVVLTGVLHSDVHLHVSAPSGRALQLCGDALR